MDIIIMNIILIIAIVTLGYYILDAIVSLFMYRSSSINKRRHRRNDVNSFTLIEVNDPVRTSHRTVKKCINS